MGSNESAKLDYYLTSLKELGELLIDADESDKIGSGILRLTLGTVMASSGFILLHKSKKTFSYLAAHGIEKKPDFSSPLKIEDKLKKHRFGFVLVNKENKWLTGNLKKNIIKAKMEVVVPLYYKNKFFGLLCVGKKFMKQEYSSADYQILNIISSHLIKALYNYELFQKVESKKRELNLKLLELETLFDISVAISSVLNIRELSEEVLGRSVGILNASKGLMLLRKENSPILEPISSFNWETKKPLLSRKTGVFKKIDKSLSGLFFSEENITS